jgi:hypothetical protein
MKGYTTEVEYKVYDDETGCYVAVTCDADGGDYIDIRQVEKDKIIARVTMSAEQARHVYVALGKYLEQLTITD